MTWPDNQHEQPSPRSGTRPPDPAPSTWLPQHAHPTPPGPVRHPAGPSHAESRVPDQGRSWAKEFGLAVVMTALTVGVATLVIVLAGLGGLVDRRYETVPASALFAGIAAGVVSLVAALTAAKRMLFESTRGPWWAVSLVIAGASASAAVVTLGTALWPSLLDPPAPPGIVAADVGRDVGATVQVFLFVTATLTVCFTAASLVAAPMVLRWSPWTLVFVAIGIVGCAIFFPLQGGMLFEKPVAPWSLGLWSLLSVIGLVTSSIVVGVMGRLNVPARPRINRPGPRP